MLTVKYVISSMMFQKKVWSDQRKDASYCARTPHSTQWLCYILLYKLFNL